MFALVFLLPLSWQLVIEDEGLYTFTQADGKLLSLPEKYELTASKYDGNFQVLIGRHKKLRTEKLSSLEVETRQVN